MTASLHRRYTLIFLGWILLVVTIVSGALFLVHHRSASELSQLTTDFITSALERQVARQGIDLGQALAHSLTNALYNLEINVIRDLASAALQQSSIVYVYVFDDSGTVVHDGTQFSRSYGIQLKDNQTKHTLTTGSPSLSKYGTLIHIIIPISLGEKVIGGVRIGLSLSGFADELRQETRVLNDVTNKALVRHIVITTIVAALLSLVGIILAALVARNLSNPIKTLSALTKHIARGEYNVGPLARRDDEIGELGEAFQQMALQLRETTVSKVYVDNILQSMDEMLIVVDAQGRIETVNRATLDELGFSEAELVGRPLATLFPRKASSTATVSQSLSIGGSAIETSILTKSEEQMPVYWSGSELKDNEGEHRQIVYVGRNISELKQAEAKLRSSLNEKQILLQEIHHRVKNNLQLISSLLSLQAQQIGDPKTANLFRESQNRVHSMALIHEQLYNSQSLAEVCLPDYIVGLVDHLKTSFGHNKTNIFFHVNIEYICLPIDVVIPCGLLINELVSNAIQHAFVGRTTGRIWIAFRRNRNQYCLEVRDNGVGLPEAYVNGMSTRLGLQLIRGLAKQLSGRLTIAADRGTSFCIVFESPLPEPDSVAANDLNCRTCYQGRTV